MGQKRTNLNRCNHFVLCHAGGPLTWWFPGQALRLPSRAHFKLLEARRVPQKNHHLSESESESESHRIRLPGRTESTGDSRCGAHPVSPVTA